MNWPWFPPVPIVEPKEATMNHAHKEEPKEAKPAPVEVYKPWHVDTTAPLTLQSLADRVAQLEARCGHIETQLKKS